MDFIKSTTTDSRFWKHTITYSLTCQHLTYDVYQIILFLTNFSSKIM